MGWDRLLGEDSMKKIFLLTLLTTNIAFAQPKLSWENKKQERGEWTTITLNAVQKNFSKLDNASDIALFCPDYEKLEQEQKKIVWGELIVALAYYESGWNPNAQLTEIGLGTDAVTHLTVVSEGLLQLSYGDTRWAKWCAFDWEADKTNTDNPTILKPRNNLECGVGILANQIAKHGRITLAHGAYWSVLKLTHKNKRIDGIARMVKQAAPYCTQP